MNDTINVPEKQQEQDVRENVANLVEDLDNLIDASSVYLTFLSEQVFQKASKVQRLSILINKNAHSLKAFSLLLEQTTPEQRQQQTQTQQSTLKSTPQKLSQSMED